MKTNVKALLTAFLLAAVLTPLAHAGGTHEAPPNNSSAELNRIKALEGRWSSTTSMFSKDGKSETVYTEYEITAGGSAVLERIFPGTPHEMISMYYDDDKGRLAMTHYCMMRNRPTFKLVKSEGDTLVLDVAKVEGLKSKNDPSMGAMTLRFKDKDHYESTCSSRGKGSEKQPPMTMEYTRVAQSRKK